MNKTIRLTTAQALVKFLCAQMTVIEGRKTPIFAGVWAIFGHGNVAGIGEALFQVRDQLPTYRGQNEQSMALSAIAYTKATNRRRIMAATTSIGPGALNMVTAAAVAHVDRLPLLLLPGDVFANAGPIPCCSRSRILATARQASMTASSRSPATSTASCAPNS
jgi:3D-(3,5/4)-trihydroxycyclohexane-1,2-dione acylhydrolase (decyclizing)